MSTQALLLLALQASIFLTVLTDVRLTPSIPEVPAGDRALAR